MRPTETEQNNLHAIASASQVRRLWLFEIDVPGGALYLAQGRQNVQYLGQTWIAGAIRHDGIGENTSGAIDSLTVEIGNLDRDSSALLALYDGLKGRKVRVVQVFSLADPGAFIEDLYYIDQPILAGAQARLTLATRFDLLDATLGRHQYSRTFCIAEYKGIGCWRGEDGNWTAPEGFAIGEVDDCDHTEAGCARHNNKKRLWIYDVPRKKTVSVM